MSEFAELIAALFLAGLPDWVRLPSLTFVLPHILYWTGLIVFPLTSMYLVRREAGRSAPAERVTAPISYLLWLTGGFVGLHRFYLRVPGLAFAYVGLFLLVLYGNKQSTVERETVSNAANALKGVEFDAERYGRAVARGRDGAGTGQGGAGRRQGQAGGRERRV